MIKYLTKKQLWTHPYLLFLSPNLFYRTIVSFRNWSEKCSLEDLIGKQQMVSRPLTLDILCSSSCPGREYAKRETKFVDRMSLLEQNSDTKKGTRSYGMDETRNDEDQCSSLPNQTFRVILYFPIRTITRLLCKIWRSARLRSHAGCCHWKITRFCLPYICWSQCSRRSCIQTPSTWWKKCRKTGFFKFFFLEYYSSPKAATLSSCILLMICTMTYKTMCFRLIQKELYLVMSRTRLKRFSSEAFTKKWTKKSSGNTSIDLGK